MSTSLAPPLAAWFEARGWTPLPFQNEVRERYRDGQSGLIHAATGSGKTLAAWGAVLDNALRSGRDATDEPLALWITPLRALAVDTTRALLEPVQDLDLAWRVERRTGDTAAAVKTRQRHALPTALVTTPESLSLLLTYPRTAEQLASLEAVVIDEWHELLGSKRGTLVQLALERLRAYSPALRVWGISATLGDLGEARDVLLGPGRDGALVEGPPARPLHLDTVVPDDVGRFPWAGHLGLHLAEAVADVVDEAASALVFVNTRAQAERWYQAMRFFRPDWGDALAIHHGALSRAQRRAVEAGIRDGAVRCAVCTSSLDLGVDFPPVDHVVQIGSAKGVARLLQRAGRSGHQPGRPARLTLVPTHAFELVEAEAARTAVAQGDLEQPRPPDLPLDVLIQHMVTVACGDGFTADGLYDEVRRTWAFRDLERDAFDGALDFAVRGGDALNAYEEYHRIVYFRDLYRASSSEAVRRHRMSIGVIVGDGHVDVKYVRGRKLGSVPESFLARLSRGDTFLLGGRALTLVRVRDMTAYVRRAAAGTPAVPRYAGGLLPLSRELATAVRDVLGDVAHGHPPDAPEIDALDRLFRLQQRWSTVPRADQTLIERTRTREGHHLFLYPFAGRLVHEGLAALVALRLARRQPVTFSLSATDYGLELLAADPVPLEPDTAAELFSPDHLEQDLHDALNESELARRQFREVARIGGLVFTGYPGSRTVRQLQASAGLIHDVLARHEPDHLLLAQARREVLERQLDRPRIADTLRAIQASSLLIIDTPRLTPFAFPILTNRLREKVSSEKARDRIKRLAAQLERAADR